ncbi:MAG TPA: PIN domain-containing protein [Blastocatellia bacterium]|nr:PIN domain-containing protein [Blastocatellia bacterium]
MYLLDTNILLELLLNQKKAGDVERLLLNIPAQTLYLTEFSLYSIGIILIRQKKHSSFVSMVEDLIERAGVSVLRLLPGDLREVGNHAQHFNLDFDDAYQYAIAERYGLTIVSFDKDFDRTSRARKEPAEIVP